MKKNNWFKSPWTIGITTAVLGPIITVIIDLIKDKPILTTIWEVLASVWEFVISILNFQLRLWWVFLGLGVLVLVLYLIDKISEKEEELPEFLNYRTDSFKHWKWSWDWNKNYNGKWEVKNLNAHCPNCGTPLIITGHQCPLVDCPRCEFMEYESERCDNPIKVERIIVDNINRKKMC